MPRLKMNKPKQTTLFQSWGSKKEENNPSNSSKSSTGRISNAKNDVINLCDDEDDDDDELLAQALDESLLYASYLPSTSNQQNPKAQSDVGNISFGIDSEEPQFSVTVPGFDRVAGKLWIYPTNYPVRDYQYKIVQQSLFKNTLVTLPTGLGKTFIASVVMYNYYRWFPSGKIMFMAPTKPLVAQQIEACYNIMGIPQSDTAEMTGNMVPNERLRAWKEKRVFFLTPQIITNDLSRGSCPAEDVKCVVVDEAHKATGNHAYCQVVRELAKYTTNFRILALSATPGSDMKAVQQVLTNLMISHIEIRTENCPDIKPYTHERVVDKIVVPLGKELTKVKTKYIEVMDSVIKRLNRQKVVYNRPTTSFSKFLLLKSRDEFRQNPPESLSPNHYGIVEGDFAMAISLFHGFELLQLHGLRSLYNYLDNILHGDKGYGRTKSELQRNADFNDVMAMLSEKFPKDNSSLSQKPAFVAGHPKMEKLLDVAIEHFGKFQDNGGTRVMIFSQYRDSVVEITDMLNRQQPLIKAMSFIGQSSSGKVAKGFTQKEQLRVMKEFREGGYNTLVSTCVGEEGLDIGDVDLIICFDAHKSPIRLVQRMGRTGRKRKGRIVMLVTEGKEEQIYNQSQYSKKSIHKAILNGSKTLQFYQHNPRMIPRGVTPACHKMHISVKKKDTDGSKNNKTGATKKTAAKVKKKAKEEKSDITLEEYRELQKYFTDLDTTKLPGPSNHSLYLDKDKQKEMLQTNDKSQYLSLSEWLPWQNRLQETNFVEHSYRSKHLVELMQFSELQEILDPENDNYGMEMRKFLNEEDTVESNTDSTRNPCDSKIQKKSKSKTNIDKPKKRRMAIFEALGETGNSEFDLPEINLGNSSSCSINPVPKICGIGNSKSKKSKNRLQRIYLPSLETLGQSDDSDDNLPDLNLGSHSNFSKTIESSKCEKSCNKTCSIANSTFEKSGNKTHTSRRKRQKQAAMISVIEHVSDNDDDFEDIVTPKKLHKEDSLIPKKLNQDNEDNDIMRDEIEMNTENTFTDCLKGDNKFASDLKSLNSEKEIDETDYLIDDNKINSDLKSLKSEKVNEMEIDENDDYKIASDIKGITSENMNNNCDVQLSPSRPSLIRTPPPLEEVAEVFKQLSQKPVLSPVDLVQLVEEWHAEEEERLKGHSYAKYPKYQDQPVPKYLLCQDHPVPKYPPCQERPVPKDLCQEHPVPTDLLRRDHPVQKHLFSQEHPVPKYTLFQEHPVPKYPLCQERTVPKVSVCAKPLRINSDSSLRKELCGEQEEDSEIISRNKNSSIAEKEMVKDFNSNSLCLENDLEIEKTCPNSETNVMMVDSQSPNKESSVLMNNQFGNERPNNQSVTKASNNQVVTETSNNQLLTKASTYQFVNEKSNNQFGNETSKGKDSFQEGKQDEDILEMNEKLSLNEPLNSDLCDDTMLENDFSLPSVQKLKPCPNESQLNFSQALSFLDKSDSFLTVITPSKSCARKELLPVVSEEDEDCLDVGLSSPVLSYSPGVFVSKQTATQTQTGDTFYSKPGGNSVGKTNDSSRNQKIGGSSVEKEKNSLKCYEKLDVSSDEGANGCLKNEKPSEKANSSSKGNKKPNGNTVENTNDSSIINPKQSDSKTDRNKVDKIINLSRNEKLVVNSIEKANDSSKTEKQNSPDVPNHEDFLNESQADLFDDDVEVPQFDLGFDFEDEEFCVPPTPSPDKPKVKNSQLNHSDSKWKLKLQFPTESDKHPAEQSLPSSTHSTSETDKAGVKNSLPSQLDSKWKLKLQFLGESDKYPAEQSLPSSKHQNSETLNVFEMIKQKNSPATHSPKLFNANKDKLLFDRSAIKCSTPLKDLPVNVSRAKNSAIKCSTPLKDLPVNVTRVKNSVSSTPSVPTEDGKTKMKSVLHEIISASQSSFSEDLFAGEDDMEDFISNQFEILDNIKKNNMPVDPVIMDDPVDGTNVSKEDLDQSLLFRLKKKKVISQSPVTYGKEMTSALLSDEEDDVQIKRRIRNSKPVNTSPREKDDTPFKTPSKPIGRQKVKRACPLNISSEEESEIGKILGDDVKMDDSDEDFAVDSFKTKIKHTENKDFKKKKRKKVKCAFIEEEAELSGEDNSSDESTGSDLGQLSGNFINDETVYSSQAHLHDSVDNQAMYLRSMRSPVQHGGKFRLQYNHKYQDVFSQVPHQDEEPSQYMEDSFCVDNDYEDSFIASEDEDSLLVVKKRDKPKKKKTKGSNIVKGKKRLCKFSDTSSDDDMRPAIPLTQHVIPLSKSPDGCKKPSRKAFFSSSEDEDPVSSRLGLNKDCDGSSREQNSVLSAVDSRNLNQNVESNSMLTTTNYRNSDQSSEPKSMLTRKSNQSVESVLDTINSKNSNQNGDSNSVLTAMNFRKSNPSIQSESVLNTSYSGNSNKTIESSNSVLTKTKSRNTDQNVQSISKPENQTNKTSENEVPIPTNSLQLPNFELDLDFFDNDFMDVGTDSEQSVKTDAVLKTSTTKCDQIGEKKSNEEKLRTERLQKQKEQKEKFKTCLVGSSNTGDVSKQGVNASTSATSATDINMEEVLTERQVIKKSNRLTLVVDTREISGAQDIISNLRFHHEINVEVRQLKTCDYVLSTRLAVDRQLWSEFSNGSNHSKLVERLQKMRGLYERCCLVVERDKTKPGAQKNKRQRSKYVDQTIATLSQSDIRILFTDSQAETVDILVQLCQLENKKGLGISVPLNLNNNQEQVLKFYLSIPKVTYIQAVQFVHKFKNISHFLNSSAKVIEIQGKLTSQRAGEIYNYINHKFDLQMVPSSR